MRTIKIVAVVAVIACAFFIPAEWIMGPLRYKIIEKPIVKERIMMKTIYVPAHRTIEVDRRTMSITFKQSDKTVYSSRIKQIISDISADALREKDSATTASWKFFNDKGRLYIVKVKPSVMKKINDWTKDYTVTVAFKTF